MNNNVQIILDGIQSLKGKRYPNLLIVQGKNNILSEETYKLISEKSGIKFVDYRDDVLLKDDTIIRGAYTRSEFQSWLNDKASENNGLLLWNCDDIIVSWDNRNRRAFFKNFLLDGINFGPSTILISWLEDAWDLDEYHNHEIKVVYLDNLSF